LLQCDKNLHIVVTVAQWSYPCREAAVAIGGRLAVRRLVTAQVHLSCRPADRTPAEGVPMAEAKLTIASKNYGSWSLRGWLLCKFAGLEFDEQMVGADDPSTRAELLLLSPSFLIKGHYPGFKVWAGAQADIDRVTTIWRECLAASGGPFLFGTTPTVADAMYAPVCTRFLTYDVKLDSECSGYCAAIMAMPQMKEWVAAAKAEPDEVLELDVEF
jgi:hypothetical protein